MECFRRFYFLLSFFSLLIAGGITSAKASLYMLKLKLPASAIVEDKMPVKCFYRGTQLTINNGFIALPTYDGSAPMTFSLIITKGLSFETDGNLVRRLRRLPHCPCIWYQLNLVYRDEGEHAKCPYHWRIEKRPLETVPLALPEQDALVVQLDPSVVAGLEQEVQTNCASTVYLPTILFIDDHEAIERAIVESSLNTDIDCIHQRPEKLRCSVKGGCA